MERCLQLAVGAEAEEAVEECRPDFVESPTVEAIRARVHASVSSGVGSIHFLASPEQAGRTSLLVHLGQTLADSTGARVLGVSFSTGEPAVWTLDKRRRIQPLPHEEGLLLLAHIASVVAATPVVGSVLGTGVALWEFIQTFLPRPSSRDICVGRDPLDPAPSEDPLLILVDDIDQAHDSFPLQRLLLRAAKEIVGYQDIHLIIAIKRESQVSQAPPELTDAQSVAEILRQRGLAVVHDLAPPDSVLLERMYGFADAEVYEELLHITNARVASTRELWDEWLGAGIVTNHNSAVRWQFSSGPNLQIARLTNELIDRKIFGAKPVTRVFERNAMILATAALQGKTFSPEAVAESLGLDPDDVIDVLDGDSADGRGLESAVRFMGWIPAGESGSGVLIGRYEFTGDLVWLRARNMYYTPEEEQAVARQLIASLSQLHATDPRPVLRTLSSLLAFVGEKTHADELSRAADFWVRQEAIEVVVSQCIEDAQALTPAEVAEAERLAHLLIRFYVQNRDRWPNKLKVAVVDTVGALGQRYGMPTALHWVLFRRVLLHLPLKPLDADRFARELAERTRGDPSWDRWNRILHAMIRFESKRLHPASLREAPDAAAKVQSYEPVMKLPPVTALAQEVPQSTIQATFEVVAREARAAEDWDCELYALGQMARLIMLSDGVPEANTVRIVSRLISVADRLQSWDGVMFGLRSLALVEAARGNHEQALVALDKALALARQLRSLPWEAELRSVKVLVLLATGELALARSILAEIVPLFKHIGSAAHYVQAAGLLDLVARRSPAEGALVEALDYLNVRGAAREQIIEVCSQRQLDDLRGLHFSEIYDLSRIIDELLGRSRLDEIGEDLYM